MCYIYWLNLPHHTDILSEGYIGVSKNPPNRLSSHKTKKLNPHLEKAFQKYNNQIQQKILLQADEIFCYEIEKQLRPTPNIGWNIKEGGNHPPSFSWEGKHHSELTKEKIKQSNLGKKRSELTKEKMRKPKSTKHKEKIRQALLGNQNFLGHKHSEETKLKMRLAKLGKSLQNLQK